MATEVVVLRNQIRQFKQSLFRLLRSFGAELLNLGSQIRDEKGQKEQREIASGNETEEEKSRCNIFQTSGGPCASSPTPRSAQAPDDVPIKTPDGDMGWELLREPQPTIIHAHATTLLARSTPKRSTSFALFYSYRHTAVPRPYPYSISVGSEIRAGFLAASAVYVAVLDFPSFTMLDACQSLCK